VHCLAAVIVNCSLYRSKKLWWINWVYHVNNSSKDLLLSLHPSLWQVYKAYELVVARKCELVTTVPVLCPSNTWSMFVPSFQEVASGKIWTVNSSQPPVISTSVMHATTKFNVFRPKIILLSRQISVVSSVHDRLTRAPIASAVVPTRTARFSGWLVN